MGDIKSLICVNCFTGGDKSLQIILNYQKFGSGTSDQKSKCRKTHKADRLMKPNISKY